MNIFSLFTLCGGLAFFLYGMTVMSKSLEKMAGGKLEKLLKRPIWVTENGTCDNQDAFRARYIYEHLHAMLRSGLPFERYYHWCFCDNFEWLEGESARFGLINVDYATQTRTIKRSGEFYADMIRNDGVTDEAYNTDVRGEVCRVE